MNKITHVSIEIREQELKMWQVRVRTSATFGTSQRIFLAESAAGAAQHAVHYARCNELQDYSKIHSIEMHEVVFDKEGVYRIIY